MAHDAGILRRAGVGYQFRHLELQAHFDASSDKFAVSELAYDQPSHVGETT
jgi:hypothetical protein